MGKNNKKPKDKICGIYCIENLINGKKYVGKAQDIHTRWRGHKNKLESKTSNCAYLQHAWNKYGKENFKFYILIECINDQKLLDKLENFYIIYLHYKKEKGE